MTEAKKILKNILLLLILLCAGSSQLIAQNQPPEIDTVIFSQRIDGTNMVDIYYDVNDPDGDLIFITMEVSDDNGSTWDFSCDSITGDVGPGITSGANKLIVWDFATEHPQTFGDQFKIKIIAGCSDNPCQGIDTVTYGGKTYNTVEIGCQCWLKENLDVGTMIQGSQNATNNGVIEKYCYDNNSNNCNIYGGLYQWDETMQYSTTPGVQGICPPGWHIPTLTEFQVLSSTVGGNGNALKAIGQGTGGGVGTNTSGFSALLAGYRINNGIFVYLGNYAYFWSSSEFNASYAFSLGLSYYNSGIAFYDCNKEAGFSVRCLKD